MCLSFRNAKYIERLDSDNYDDKKYILIEKLFNDSRWQFSVVLGPPLAFLVLVSKMAANVNHFPARFVTELNYCPNLLFLFFTGS